MASNKTIWRILTPPSPTLPRKIISHFLFLIALRMPHTASAVSSMLPLALAARHSHRKYTVNIYCLFIAADAATECVIKMAQSLPY